MIRITEEIAELLTINPFCSNMGLFMPEFGAVVGDAEFVIYYKDDEDIPYLAHISEFEQQGILIKLKEKNGKNK